MKCASLGQPYGMWMSRRAADPGFEQWLSQLWTSDEDDGDDVTPYDWAPGELRWLRRLYDEEGPLEPEEAWSAFNAEQLRVARAAIDVVMTDLNRTSAIRPRVRVDLFDGTTVRIFLDGSFTTPSMSAIDETEALVEAADYFQTQGSKPTACGPSARSTTPGRIQSCARATPCGDADSATTTSLRSDNSASRARSRAETPNGLPPGSVMGWRAHARAPSPTRSGLPRWSGSRAKRGGVRETLALRPADAALEPLEHRDLAAVDTDVVEPVEGKQIPSLPHAEIGAGHVNRLVEEFVGHVGDRVDQTAVN